MSKKQSTLFTACLAGSAIIIGITSGVFTSLLLFLFVGKIPGTQLYLSPLQMGLVLSFVAVFAAYTHLKASHKMRLKKRYLRWKQQLPARRFTQA